MIRICVLAWALIALIPGYATTLVRASLDDLIAKSTSVVRGRVTGSYAAAHGPLVYTYYKIQVTERWKGAPADSVEVQVPGGSIGGMRQNIGGAPQLTQSSEYVFFLWTGPSGANHLLGLSQGVLDITKDSAGNLIVVRNATGATVIDGVTGLESASDSIRMSLNDLSSRVLKSVKGVQPK